MAEPTDWMWVYENPKDAAALIDQLRSSITIGDLKIEYDQPQRIVTIDGYRFSRELLSHLTASPPGVWFRIVSRAGGVIAIEKVSDTIRPSLPPSGNDRMPGGGRS